MAQISKQELKEKVSNSGIDSEVMLSLLEDIEDSMNEVVDNTEELNTIKEQNEELSHKYDELVDKYKSRFLSSNEEEKEPAAEEKKESEIEVKREDIFKEVD